LCDENGHLVASDIFNIKLNCDLVTLSACESGVSEVLKGDEILGFVRAFLYAGAPTMPVSLWKVADQATQDFMKNFYQQWLESKSNSIAMKDTISLFVNRSDMWQHPFLGGRLYTCRRQLIIFMLERINMEIKISSDSIGILELKNYLENSQFIPNDFEFQLQSKSIQLRGADPTVLVAVIGSVITALVGLITGILSVVKEKQLGKVMIESKDGIKIEIPANYPMEKLDDLLDKVKRIE
jgi:hypothetical protein